MQEFCPQAVLVLVASLALANCQSEQTPFTCPPFQMQAQATPP